MFSLINKDSIKYIIGALAVLGILGYGYSYISGLKSTIASNKIAIDKLNSRLVTSKVVIVNRDNIIEAKEAENNDLVKALDKLNKSISDKANKLAESKKALLKWKRLSKVKKYVYLKNKIVVNGVDYSTADCEQGIELMNNIAKTNYDDI